LYFSIAVKSIHSVFFGYTQSIRPLKAAGKIAFVLFTGKKSLWKNYLEGWLPSIATKTPFEKRPQQDD
jgi:hypothetical protein